MLNTREKQVWQPYQKAFLRLRTVVDGKLDDIICIFFKSFFVAEKFLRTTKKQLIQPCHFFPEALSIFTQNLKRTVSKTFWKTCSAAIVLLGTKNAVLLAANKFFCWRSKSEKFPVKTRKKYYKLRKCFLLKRYWGQVKYSIPHPAENFSLKVQTCFAQSKKKLYFFQTLQTFSQKKKNSSWRHEKFNFDN